MTRRNAKAEGTAYIRFRLGADVADGIRATWNMQFRWSETFEVDELRELLGVSGGELTTFGNLNA